MKVRGMTAVLAVAAIGFIANSALAETVSIKGHNPDQVQGKCDGTYFAPSSKGVYGCLNNDGSGIVCGGVGKYAKTCDTFRKAPPTLPSRDAIRKAEKAEQAKGSEKK
jgi:hypothetical protein